MSAQYSLLEIVSKLGGELIGDGALVVSGVASLASAKSGQISFLSSAKYRSQLANTKASAIVVNAENRDATALPRIATENPYAYFAKLSTLLNPGSVHTPGIGMNAVVHNTASVPDSCTIAAHSTIGRDVKLGENVVIGPGCIIGDRVTIAEGSQLQANVVIYHDCVIGKQCVLSAGVVIGADGFGYAEDADHWVKIPQVGRVVIEDGVDIGANTTVDRGALDDTVIEAGVKLDNQIQIGHNCRIGAHTMIAGCVGIAGSARIGRHCKIGGAAMILGHLEIADGVTVSPGSMITRSITKAGTYTALMPFQSHEDWLKTAANIRRLGELTERVKQLEKELATLNARPKKTITNKEKP
jgi:UDP-3-O-[3-hydroxymyristoyl] glucosamine N-acyltransferase